MKSRLAVSGIVVAATLVLALAGACGGGGDEEENGPGGPESSCSNGIDDNKNGLVDCDDSSCTSNVDCYVDAGIECTSQDECVSGTGSIAQRFTYADPLPQCLAERCREQKKARIYFSVNTANHSGKGAMGSLNTRFVSKRDVEGNAVTCDILKQVSDAQETVSAEAWAGAIENSKRFNVLAFDVVSLSGSQSGETVFNPYLTTATAKDFIVWTEVWYGGVGSNTKLPTGNRMAVGCYESGPVVAEITEADGALPDGGLGRKFEVVLP